MRDAGLRPWQARAHTPTIESERPNKRPWGLYVNFEQASYAISSIAARIARALAHSRSSVASWVGLTALLFGAYLVVMIAAALWMPHEWDWRALQWLSARTAPAFSQDVTIVDIPWNPDPSELPTNRLRLAAFLDGLVASKDQPNGVILDFELSHVNRHRAEIRYGNPQSQSLLRASGRRPSRCMPPKSSPSIIKVIRRSGRAISTTRRYMLPSAVRQTRSLPVFQMKEVYSIGYVTRESRLKMGPVASKEPKKCGPWSPVSRRLLLQVRLLAIHPKSQSASVHHQRSIGLLGRDRSRTSLRSLGHT